MALQAIPKGEALVQRGWTLPARWVLPAEVPAHPLPLTIDP